MTLKPRSIARYRIDIPLESGSSYAFFTPKWGLVTRDGEIVLPPTYFAIARFGDLFRWQGSYRRTQRVEWGYLSPNGKLVWSGVM